MEGVVPDLQRQLRTHRATAIGALLIVFTLVGVGPRNQRALFATLPFGNPEALAAIVVPPASSILYPGRGYGGPLGNFGVPAPPPAGFATPFATPTPFADAAGAVPPAPVALPPGPQFAGGSSLPDLVPGLPPSLPGAPGGVPGGSVDNPGGGGTPIPGGPGGGDGPGGGGPTTPVAEPASWLMMIGGVSLVGAVLRRTSRRHRKASRV